MESIKLKPCPFCGSDVKLYIVKPGDVYLMMIKCKNSDCGATMSFDNTFCNIIPGLTVEYYNKRAGEPEVDKHENN